MEVLGFVDKNNGVDLEVHVLDPEYEAEKVVLDKL